METQTLHFSTFLPRYCTQSSSSSSSSSSYYMINTKGSRTITTTSLLSKHKTPLQVATTTTTTDTNKNRLSYSFVNNILNTLDGLICDFLDRRPLPHDFDPKNALSENYEPVFEEVPPIACPVVVGSLPPCLDGAYIRNGPNPRFVPKGPYHIFDGDGMLHMIRISGGRATFCSRYVKTHKYERELEFGNPLVPNFVAGFNGLAASVARSVVMAARVMIARQFDPLGRGMGVANTSVALLSGGRRLFALCESDLPYEIKVTDDGDITTIGRHRFQSVESSFRRMTAHPKVDRVTGVAFAFRYGPWHPFLTFHRIDPDGRKQRDVPIFSKGDCTVVHDFGLTENYAVFPDTQLVINPLWIFARDRGSPLGIDHGKIPRLGIISNCAEDESGMQWVDAPGLNMLHCVNAWEEDGGDTIVMVASNVLKVEHFITHLGLSEPTLEKVSVDMKAKSVRRRRLSRAGRCFHELGTINPAYTNKKSRYVYVGILESKAVIGVEKFDLSMIEEGGDDCMVASRMHGPGCYGGEPFFVAKEPNNPMADEDDGYLVSYVHDENTRESRFVVMDAKSPDLEIIAAVKLPQRIPSGFHGLFVSEKELTELEK